MASDLRTLTAAILTTLKTANGAAPYTYDLSGNDRVTLNRTLQPARISSVANVTVYPGELQTSRDDTKMGWHKRTMTWEILGYVRPAENTPESRVYAAMDLLNDICQALEGAEADSWGTSIPHWGMTINGEAFVGGTTEAPDSLGVVNAVVSATWRVRKGA